MFEEPSCYSKLSDDYKKETKWLMDRCWDLLRWGPEETILDVGCGSADTLYHVILPALPRDFKTLVGVDISNKMIEYAVSRWQEPRLSFQVMDISTPRDPLSYFQPDIQRAGGFDKITSFFCLQWVKDRRLMLSNLYQLLRPGGSVLILLVVRSGIYNVWDKIAARDAWRKILQDVELPLNEYVYMEDFESVFCEAARSIGFAVRHRQVLERRNIFVTSTDTDQEMIQRLKSVDPFLRVIPEELKDQYLQELLKTLKADISPRGATDYTGLLVLLNK